jgi:Protein of unknown function (DUF3617)
MRKIILSGVAVLLVAGLWSAALLAAGLTRLNVKTGLWETTTTGVNTGKIALPPDVAARLSPEQRAKIEAAMAARGSQGPKTVTSQHCVTEEELTKDPFTDRGKDAKWKCDQTALNSTGSSLEVHEVCSDGSSKMDMHVSVQAIDSEHVKGNVQADMTMGGHTMHQNTQFTSKWLGASCPAEK